MLLFFGEKEKIEGKLFFAPPSSVPNYNYLNITEKRFCQETLTNHKSLWEQHFWRVRIEQGILFLVRIL